MTDKELAAVLLETLKESMAKHTNAPYDKSIAAFELSSHSDWFQKAWEDVAAKARAEMETDYKNAREAFLGLMTDADWAIEYDADTNSNGMQVDCSTFHLDSPIQSLDDLCTAFGIQEAPGLTTLEEAITKAVKAE